MKRLPFQVLVLPFRRSRDSFEYAVFKRSDSRDWQFIAGGVDEGEDFTKAAAREAFEEGGIPMESELMRLDTISSMPANIFKDWKSWPQETYIVKEYAFGVNVNDSQISISHEHSEMKWCSYLEATNLLKWDSNRTALWELNERLTKVVGS